MWNRKFQPLGFLSALTLALIFSFGCGGGGSTSTPPPPPPAVSITVSPSSKSVQVGQTVQFTASVTNASDTSVKWQVNNVNGGDSIHGTIDPSGLYTAPSTPPSPATVTIQAISNA